MEIRLVLVTGLAVASIAGSSSASERKAYLAISGRDYATAERQLKAERRIHPQRPELMLNLAAVYRATGREAEAAALYRDVLAQPPVDLDLPSGVSRSSHDLATTGLAKAPNRQMVAR